MGGRQALPEASRTLGERFAAERERLAMSRAELAHAVGFSSEQIRKVELGERLPGAELLSALMELGGNVQYVLGASTTIDDRYSSTPGRFPTAEEMHQAQLREAIRREARAHRQLRADRRKKVLSDDEVTLIEAFRDLSARQRADELARVQGLADGHGEPASKAGVSVRGGIRSAGRDYHEGDSGGRKKR